MEVRVRDLDKNLVEHIDNLAKINGLSRQRFLKMYLERIGTSNILVDEQRRINDRLHDIRNIVHLLYKQVEVLQDNTDKLLMLVSDDFGIDVDSIDLLHDEGVWLYVDYIDKVVRCLCYYCHYFSRNFQLLYG